MRNLYEHLLLIATPCFNSRCLQSYIWAKKFGFPVERYRSTGFEDDSFFYRKPVSGDKDIG